MNYCTIKINHFCIVNVFTIAAFIISMDFNAICFIAIDDPMRYFLIKPRLLGALINVVGR